MKTNKLILIGLLLAVVTSYLAYAYIQTQRQIAENGRYQQMGNRVLDTRTGETRKLNEPIKNTAE